MGEETKRAAVRVPFKETTKRQKFDVPIVWDETTPGFGMRISPTGRRSWIAVYRSNGKTVWETIGTITDWGLSQARERAKESRRKAKDGHNPNQAKKDTRAAREAQAKADEESRFERVAQRYLKEGVKRDGSTGYEGEVRRIFEHDIIPRWRDKPIRSITYEDVDALIKEKAASRERTRKGTNGGAGVQGNRTLAPLRRFFQWCIKPPQRLIAVDPTEGVNRQVKERARDRKLSDTEIAWFWRATERAGWPFDPIFKLLLLTGQRVGEVAGMRWSEIDQPNRLWTIPAERNKSKREHVVPLSEMVMEIIDPLPRIGELVFPGRLNQVIASFGKPKDRIDAAMQAQWTEAGADPHRVIKPWVVHDLRRTARSVMARLNVAPIVAEKVLNHSVPGLIATYDLYEYLDERRDALETLARHINGLLHPTQSNVVPLLAPAV